MNSNKAASASAPREVDVSDTMSQNPVSNEKGAPISAEEANPSDEPKKPVEFPMAWKLTVLACGFKLSWSSSFSENTLVPLKSTLIKQLDNTNAQYGAISAATSLFNSILPIIGGYALDYYGVEWGSMICSVAIFIGAVVSAAGSNQDTFGLVLAGRIIMGFGSTIIETCTSKILAHWFQHRGLGLVYGLDLSIGCGYPDERRNRLLGLALWIPAIVCFANLLQNIFYVWWVRSRPEWTRMPTGKQRALEISRRATATHSQAGSNDAASDGARTSRFAGLPDLRSLLRVPRFSWIVVYTQILQAGTVGGFNGLNADIITLTRGSTAQLAGYTSAIQQVIPVVCAPLVGSFFDFFGHRMVFVIITSVIWILVYCLIGFTHVNALGAMVIASVASTINALPFLASIPLMVPSQLELGLVFGIWKSFNSSGSVVVDMIAGRLQDITPGQTYERIVSFFVAVKVLEFCLGLFYGVLDRRYLAGILTMTEKKRHIMEDEGKLGEPIGRKPSKVFSITGILLLTSLVIVAWVLFIRYSI